MEINIRKATCADIDAVDEIYNRIHSEIENGNAATGWVRGVYPTRETAKASLEASNLFVEELDGKVVGTAIINQSQAEVYKDAAWQYNAPDEKIMVLHTLVVNPDVKGCGLGKAFVKFYEEYAAENGCTLLRMDTNEKNTNARNFYKKLGFSEAGILPCEFNGISGVKLVMLEKKPA